MNQLDQLNKLLKTPFEKWRENGVRLAAVSANADGIVESGLLDDARRTHFYRTTKDGKDCFVIEEE